MTKILTKFTVLLYLIVLESHIPLVFAGDNIWTSDGPTGASVKTIAINPLNNNIIYIGTIQNGVYKSTDAGEDWTHLEISNNPQSTTMREIVIHPFGPDTVYAATRGGIFKSTDSGLFWINISPPGRENQEFRAVVLDPIHPNIVITGGVWDRWKSTDSGQSWAEFSIDPEGGLDHEIDALEINPLNPNIMYLITPDTQYGKGIYKSTDEGGTWFVTQNNSDSSGVGSDIEIDPIDTNTIYYARNDGYRDSAERFFSKSTDGGSSWSDITPQGLSDWVVLDICISPVDHNTLFIGTSADGIFMSPNGGMDWFQQNDSLRSLMVFSIEIAPSMNTIFIGMIMDGIYKSSNGGVTWRKISQNILAADIYDLAFAAGSHGVFAVSQIGCYFQESEGGLWRYINTGVPFRNKVGSIESDKLDSSYLYISTFTPYYPPTSPNGLYISTDNGSAWRFSNNGLPEDQSFLDIAVSCLEDSSRKIFMGTGFNLPSDDIYYSDDMGENWNRCQGGLPDQAYSLIKVAPNNPYLILAADDHNRLYLSTDRGDTWSETARLPRIGDEYVNDIEFDPASNAHIYASCSFGGLFESTDMGQSWININNDLAVDPSFPRIYGPAVNPHDPLNAFVFSNHRGVYQTHDGGRHWVAFNNGFDVSASSGNIYMAPNDTTLLYVATPDHSVWSIHRTLDGVDDDAKPLPSAFTVSSYPNPFNPATTIKYSLPSAGKVSIVIYNINGQKITEISNSYQLAGEHSLVWNASAYPSGLYFARLQCDEDSRAIKMLLVK